MKKILLVIIIPIAAIIVAYNVISNDTPASGFKRIIKKDFLQEQYHASYNAVLISICGISKNNIYYSTINPNLIFATSKNLKSKFVTLLPFRPDLKITHAFSMEVDSPNIKLFAGNIPGIIYGKILGSDSLLISKMKGSLFNNAIKCSDNSFVVRSYNKDVKDFIFTKVNPAGEQLAIEHNASILKHDDGMSTQGTLLYDFGGKRIFYVYKLFNTILCLDTNLNVLYKSRTIDTVTTTTSNFRKYTKDNKRVGTFSTVPHYTNRLVCMTSKNLLVNSLIRSDDENSAKIKNTAVIDVYNLNDSKYQYSFYLSVDGGQKLTAFKIQDSTLIAVFDRGKGIAVYKTSIEL